MFHKIVVKQNQYDHIKMLAPFHHNIVESNNENSNIMSTIPSICTPGTKTIEN